MLALALGLLAAAAAPGVAHQGTTCPRSDRAPVVSRAPAARSMLVPPGASSLVICRYSGLNPPHGVHRFRLMAAGTSTAPPTLAKFTSRLNALRPGRQGAAYSCPTDDGSALLAFFSYPSGPGVTVKVGLTGCGTITNGHVRRLALGAPVVAQLANLPRASTTTTGVAPWPSVPPWEPAGS